MFCVIRVEIVYRREKITHQTTYELTLSPKHVPLLVWTGINSLKRSPLSFFFWKFHKQIARPSIENRETVEGQTSKFGTPRKSFFSFRVRTLSRREPKMSFKLMGNEYISQTTYQIKAAAENARTGAGGNNWIEINIPPKPKATLTLEGPTLARRNLVSRFFLQTQHRMGVVAPSRHWVCSFLAFVLWFTRRPKSNKTKAQNSISFPHLDILFSTFTN